MTETVRTDAEGLRDMLMRIRYDTTAIQAKVTDALTLLSRMPVPQTVQGKLECPVCGPMRLNKRQLAEHIYDIHAGPRPQHLDELAARLPDQQEANT